MGRLYFCWTYLSAGYRHVLGPALPECSLINLDDFSTATMAEGLAWLPTKVMFGCSRGVHDTLAPRSASGADVTLKDTEPQSGKAIPLEPEQV